ncbi:DNA primase [Thiovibrio frasassiensis]|uniref:DNA primase n=1 Tax=Thiovibrio frasassiensis TaxID=2984131 RepID=A0A9X4MFE2_9BACT|nr:DNA primase [Thiovibrio frasassiensis]MDG4475346.1 DNA primase [Thiovibrio frasassiensis]
MAVNQGDDTVQLIKDAADIAEIIGEHVSLKRAGTNLKGLCPFHSEKTPSFTVNPDRKTYHCFGCGEGGDVFSFMMNFHHLSFVEALKELARKYQIALPEKPLNPQELEKAQKREAMQAANEKAAELFHQLLLSDASAKKAREYLEQRGISEEISKEFRLGFAPDSWNFLVNTLPKQNITPDAAKEAGLIVPRDNGGFYDRFRNRVMFPIVGLTGRVIAFGGRILDDGQPKYMNSPESPVFDKSRTLFGLFQNREHIRQAKNCLVVEGNFDLISLAVHGVRNVVAPLGTALTQAQIRSLKGYTDEVILLFDGDQAGLKAAMRSVPLFLSEQVTARIAVLPEDHDPDTFVREFGREGLDKHLKTAMPLPEFVFDKLVAQYGASVAGKAKIVAELQELIKAIGDQHLQRTLFVSHFAKKLGLSPQQLLAGVILPPPANSQAAKSKAGQGKGEAPLPMKQRQLLEFLLAYPEYLPAFLEAGLEEIIMNRFGLAILHLLKKQPDLSGGSEQLLELATGPERAFISELLISTPSHSEEMKEQMAQEMLSWLTSSSLKAKKERLMQQISEAQQTQNEQLLLELMSKKIQMDEALHS